MLEINLELPWPPSVNHYWFTVASKGGGRLVIGKRGKEFRQQVKEIVEKQKLNFGDARVGIFVQAFVPDKRKRDLDNLIKPLLDALEHSKVFNNDEQIDVLLVVRGNVYKGGKLVIHMESIDESN